MDDITVAMFTVASQDAAVAFYTEKLGFEVRADTRFGPNGEYRWVEVAPPGSHARLALNEPMGDSPGGGGIGIGVAAEAHAGRRGCAEHLQELALAQAHGSAFTDVCRTTSPRLRAGVRHGPSIY